MKENIETMGRKFLKGFCIVNSHLNDFVKQEYLKDNIEFEEWKDQLSTKDWGRLFKKYKGTL